MLFALPALSSKSFNLYRFVNTPIGYYEVHGLYIVPTYWMVVAIILMLFLLVFTLARMRYLYVHWSMGKQSIAFIFWGFIMAIIVEGMLMIFGRTLFTEVIGWKTAPKPISTALDIGRDKLINVLGEQKEIPSANASTKKTPAEILQEYSILNHQDAESVRSAICSP